MKSGKPLPVDDLRMLMERKRSLPSLTCEIVSEASRWLKAVLEGAGVNYHYAACADRDYYGFAVVSVSRRRGSAQLVMELKVAEIGEQPYIFADVRMLGQGPTSFFPFFGTLGDEEGRELALNYISDFLLSTDPA